jgi:hypothetical protein
MKNKKGSHVGMVLSFTLFIVFLIFVYTIVGSPVKTRRENENIFQDIQKKILEEVSEEIYTTRIGYGESMPGGEDCYEISNPENDFSEINSIVIQQEVNEEVGSIIEGDLTKIDPFMEFTKIYYSETPFENTEEFIGTNCILIDADSISKEERILERKIISLMEKMANNYTLIKEEFGIGGNIDFHLEFEYDNGTKIEGSEFNEDLKREIFARSFYISYLSLDAREKAGRFLIRVW